jgi:ribosome-binding factor A
VIDEKKMKNLPSELKAAKELEKHKERMKNKQGTSMMMKKVVNLEFQKQANSEKVRIGLQQTIKKVEGLK